LYNNSDFYLGIGEEILKNIPGVNVVAKVARGASHMVDRGKD
jgi:hypothetical protein